MHTTFARFAFACLLAALSGAASLVAAQGEWIASGSIVATIDGVEQTTHAYDIVVTDDSGTTVIPGATFAYIDEMKMGEMVLVPASYFITILTYDMDLIEVQQGAIELKLTLDPITLELSQPDEVRVTYFPDGPNPDKYYVLTQGELKLDPVVVLDDTTWRISGTVQGLFSHQLGYEPVHNPDDYFSIDARFEFERVVALAPAAGQ